MNGLVSEVEFVVCHLACSIAISEREQLQAHVHVR